LNLPAGPLSTMSEKSESSDPICVGIGLIRRGDTYLVRRRPAGTVYAGYWEFPGGKCEPGESPAQTTVRECLEETGLTVVIDRLRRVIEHHYPHGHVRLHFFDCVPAGQSAEPATGSGCRWASASELGGLRFPEANEAILEELSNGG
jgi:8-oxo-dGTP diphosphatase